MPGPAYVNKHLSLSRERLTRARVDLSYLAHGTMGIIGSWNYGYYQVLDEDGGQI